MLNHLMFYSHRLTVGPMIKSLVYTPTWARKTSKGYKGHPIMLSHTFVCQIIFLQDLSSLLPVWLDEHCYWDTSLKWWIWEFKRRSFCSMIPSRWNVFNQLGLLLSRIQYVQLISLNNARKNSTKTIVIVTEKNTYISARTVLKTYLCRSYRDPQLTEVHRHRI